MASITEARHAMSALKALLGNKLSTTHYNASADLLVTKATNEWPLPALLAGCKTVTL